MKKHKKRYIQIIKKNKRKPRLVGVLGRASRLARAMRMGVW